MHRHLLPLLTVVLTACGGGTDPRGSAPDTTVPAEPAPAIATTRISGHVESMFYGGSVLRDVRFSAGVLPDGTPSGSLQVVLQGAGGFSGHADQSEQPLRFDVTCVEIDGARAWIGGRSRGPGPGPSGFGDVWYVEDGGATAPDRVGVWAGFAPEDCGSRPDITWAAPVERGALVIRAR